MLNDGIGWVRFPGIWEEGSKLQLTTQKSPSKKFRSAPYFLHPKPAGDHFVNAGTVGRSLMTAAARREAPRSCRNRSAFPDLFKL